MLYRTVLNLETGEEAQVELTEEEIAYVQSIPDPVVPPDWNVLYGRLLAYDLKPIFDEIKAAAKTSLAFNTDYTNIIEAFKLRTEQALRDCLDELIADGYVISEEHKAMWNAATEELNFSELVRLA